jgi:hypothetical protein
MIDVRRLLVAVTLVLIVGVCVAPAVAANPPAPTSDTQPLRDGCQRSDFGIGFDTSPEWVYVYRSAAIRMAQGIVRVAHGSLQDSILEHRSFDFNANLVPDPPFRYLIAGSRSRHTSNFAPGGGEEQGRLHFEWESATMPLFVWPTDGDRATVWGSWIWDCGHWQSGENNTTGVTTGEHSELHPLSAIAVNRRAPYLSARGESETDVFVSNEGDASHAVEQCALSHHSLTSAAYPQYDAGFKPCATAPANRLQPLARSYSFFVPAPPRPVAGARLQYRVVNRITGGSGNERVRKEANGLEVTATLHGASHEVRYGKSFFVSWTGRVRHAPGPLEVTLKSILIRQSDPNPAVPDPSGAHWVLYLDLNGYWQLLNMWAPRLTTHVTDSERISINRTVRIYVPHGAGVWLQVAGRECDEPAGKTVLGIFTNLLYPCPANTDEQNPNILDVFNNDDTGTILDTYRSGTAAIGSHVSTSVATTNRFPGSGPITFGDGKQGQGDYQLTYTIHRG